MWIPDRRDLDVEHLGDILQRSLTKVLLRSGSVGFTIARLKHTTSIRTAKSLLCDNQNAQLANHRLPSLKASGTTVSLRISCKTGPSSFPSTILAKAIASCTSPIFFKQILTASFKAPPSRKNAAAYSERPTSVSRTEGVMLYRHKPHLCLLKRA